MLRFEEVPKIPFKKLIVPLALVGVLIVVGYSVAVFLCAPAGGGWDWFNNLAAAVFSIIFAVVVGYVLFVIQTRDTDNKRREELRSLLKAELTETLQKIKKKPSNTERTMQDYVQPLIIEEAVKSGLFAGSLSRDLLRLAKTYRRYNIHVASMTDAIVQGHSEDSEVYEGFDRRLRQGEKEVAEGSRELLEKLG